MVTDRNQEVGGKENGTPQPQPGESSPPASDSSPAQGSAAESPSALPQFHDLPDMTAEQAAAILRAVENLERQQRRERAEKASAAKPRVEIDW